MFMREQKKRDIPEKLERRELGATVWRKSVLVITLTFLGGATLLGSWISQNYFQAKWLEERIYLEKTQFLVEIVQNKAEMWQIQLNLENASEPPNKDRLLTAAYNLFRSVSTLLAWEESRVSEGSSASAPVAVKIMSLDIAKQLYDKRDLDGLLKLVGDATLTKAQFQAQLDHKFFERMEQSRETAETWNNRFLWFYLVGTVLLGARWVLTAILGWPSQLTTESSDGFAEIVQQRSASDGVKARRR